MSILQRLFDDHARRKSQGTWKETLLLESPQAPHVRMRGHGDVLVLSSNNYLGLAHHPEVVRAGIEGLRRYGAGTASVRFICGSFSAHEQLEKTLASFLKKEAVLSYVSCWNANTGLLPAIAGEGDLLLSDELNHASLIDACRLCSKQVDRHVYRHADMQELKTVLKGAGGRPGRIVVSDGVFSMEGDLAPLPDLVDLCRSHDALLVLDDSHGLGVLGAKGAGVPEHFGLEKEVDIITGTLGKALGGAAGGFVAGPQTIIDHLFQVSRPMLFSNALPPTVACSADMALKVLGRQPELVARLQDMSATFRRRLQKAGFKPLPGESAIIPILVGETSSAIEMSRRLLGRGVFVTGFGHPVVPEGKARIRLQMSAALADKDLDQALDALVEVGREMKLI